MIQPEEQLTERVQMYIVPPPTFNTLNGVPRRVTFGESFGAPSVFCEMLSKKVNYFDARMTATLGKTEHDKGLVDFTVCAKCIEQADDIVESRGSVAVLFPCIAGGRAHRDSSGHAVGGCQRHSFNSLCCLLRKYSKVALCQRKTICKVMSTSFQFSDNC